MNSICQSTNRNNSFLLRLVPALIAFSLFFSISSHLRMLTGGIVGPGEITLVVAAVLGFAFCKPWQQLKNPILWFWGLLGLTMALGFMTGTLHGNWVVRNATAYLFTGLVVIGLASLLAKLSNYALKQTLFLLTVVTGIGMWTGFVVYMTGDLLLMSRFALNDLGDVRYGGWSSNPNQLALLFIPLPIWLAGLWRNVNKPRLFLTLGYGLFLFSLILIGFIVRSDGLFAVWVIGFAGFIVLRLCWNMKGNTWSLLGYAMTVVICVVLVKLFFHGEIRKSFNCTTHAIVQGVNPLRSACYQEAIGDRENLHIGYSNLTEKTGTRRDLWLNGFMAWREAPVFGHGPGAFSWFSNPELQNNFEVAHGGFYREEAHNVPIDLLTQGGPLLVLGWFGVLLYLLVGAWRIRDAYTFSVVIMVALFTLFHYHLRQPYLWFILIVCHEAIHRKLFVSAPGDSDCRRIL